MSKRDEVDALIASAIKQGYAVNLPEPLQAILRALADDKDAAGGDSSEVHEAIVTLGQELAALRGDVEALKMVPVPHVAQGETQADSANPASTSSEAQPEATEQLQDAQPAA